MTEDIDIIEPYLQKNPKILDMLLFDQSSRKNILWATDEYAERGPSYGKTSEILPRLITGKSKIEPRFRKTKASKAARAKGQGEIFTPLWVCNQMNNTTDELFLEKGKGFNTDIPGQNRWVTNKAKVVFSEGKTWLDYVESTRLEITCGEAPFVTSRYDMMTGVFVPVENRIGFLDRKLRVVNENAEDNRWFEFAKIAYKASYASELVGDSVFLARKNLLATFFENHRLKFKRLPSDGAVTEIAEIISWNVWQMDMLKGVIPYSCSNDVVSSSPFKGPFSIRQGPCEGCLKRDIKKHNGIPCFVMDWPLGVRERFCDIGDQ